jgi:hypothetical protein
MPDAEGTPTWEELYERAGRRIDELHAEVERLRGIVQADLEEKAEAWGEVELLKSALMQYVDTCVMHALEERMGTYRLVNDGELDQCHIRAMALLGLAPSPGASHE